MTCFAQLHGLANAGRARDPHSIHSSAAWAVGTCLVLLLMSAPRLVADERATVTGRVAQVDASAGTFRIEDGKKPRTLRFDASTRGSQQIREGATLTVVHDTRDYAITVTPHKKPGTSKPTPRPKDAAKRSEKADDNAPTDQAAHQSPTPDHLEREARRRTTAKEALSLYRGYLANRAIREDHRQRASVHLDEWVDRARKDLHRVGKKWLPAEAVEAARQRSTALVEQAMVLLANQERSIAEKRLREAVIADPDNTIALCWLGLVQAFQGDFKGASDCFRDAHQADERDASALNNWALCSIRLRDYDAAMDHFNNAFEEFDGTGPLPQNVERFYQFLGDIKTGPNKSQLRERANQLLAQISNVTSEPRHPVRGWVYCPPSSETEVAVPKGVPADYFWETACMSCNGQMRVQCPARNCVRGKVRVTRDVVGAINPNIGRAAVLRGSAAVPCETCEGTGFVRCLRCGGSGRDP